jgi:DNA polymerase
MMSNIGLKREDVYLTNIVLDRLPQNRAPNQDELAYYAPFQDRIVDIIRPAVIATLGRFAMAYLLKKLDLPEKRGKISDLHGKLIKATLLYGDIHVLPMYHPAVALYTASKKDTLLSDFEKLRLFM